MTMNSLRSSLAFDRFSRYSFPWSIRMVGVPLRYFRIRGNFLDIVLIRIVTPP